MQIENWKLEIKFQIQIMGFNKYENDLQISKNLPIEQMFDIL